MKIDALKRKRDDLDRQIREHGRFEKRKAEVAVLAAKAEILDLSDQVLLQNFRDLAAVTRGGSGHAPVEKSVSTGAGR